MQPSPRRDAAYGLRLAGLEAAERWLVSGPASWPAFAVHVEVGDRQLVEQRVLGDRIELFLRTGGDLIVDARERSMRFRLPSAPDPSAIAHPYLAPAAEVAAFLLGRESFHAGAVAGADGAWAVVGDRGAGKSSTLALLATNGIGVVADDVLVLEGQTVFAGPRAIDLREETASHLGIGEPLGVVGARERWRLPLEPVDVELPFRGWIFLGWGPWTTRRLGGVTTLERLAANRGVNLSPRRPAAFLPLAALPAYEVLRPNALDSLEQTAQAVAEIASLG